ncbi:Schwann cell myelin protein-like isoform X2 [Paramisgurnus dabryanus]|uniref:Schwann cell myelin protein-like isoform X2 n=1 Tax=Paramisgurnus dabryanus TaxID=90735 RepID=UPI003CCF8E89
MKMEQQIIIFICLLKGVWCGDLNISLPEKIEALRGSCVTINCRFDIDKIYDKDLTDSAVGVWYKDGTDTKKVFDSNKPKFLFKEKITGKLKDKDCTTIFYNVTSKDKGRYKFRIEGNGKLKYTYKQSVSINVTASPRKPKVKMFKDQMEVKVQEEVLEGSSMCLRCSAKTLCSSSPPTLTWSSTDRLHLNESSRLQLDKKKQTEIISDLNFTATHLQHGVTFICTITYQLQQRITTAQRNITLRVQYAPENTSVSVFPSNSVLEGSSVTLICSSDGNPAVFNYTWYRENGGQLEELQTGYNLTFNVTDRTHTGLYYCQARNQHGTQNTSVLLDIQYAPENTSVSVFPSNSVLEGSSVTLICSSDGNPAVFNYTWYRENGGQLEDQTGYNLTFNVTHRTHTGLYYCQTKNQHGTQNTSVLLDIQYAPENTSVSVFPSNPVLEGSSVTLICSSDGNPAVLNFTWYRENGEQLQTGYNLTFNVTDRTHTGRYYCQTRNQHGTQNTSVLLDIQYAAKISLFICNRTDVTVCLCEAHGNPSPKVDWFLSGRPVSNSTNTFISEERLSSTDLRSFISLHQSLTHTDTLQCVIINTHSIASHQIQLLHCSHETSFSLFSVLIGAAIGASVMMILWVIQHLCNRSLKSRREDTTGLVLTDRENEEPVYGNKTDEETSMNCQESLHYSSIDFTNTQIESEEIRGVSSLTADYAVLRHYSGQEEAKSSVGSVKPLDNSNISTVKITYSKARDLQFNISTDTEQDQSKKTDLQSDEDIYAEVKRCHLKN